MREIRPSGSEGGGLKPMRPPYPYFSPHDITIDLTSRVWSPGPVVCKFRVWRHIHTALSWTPRPWHPTVMPITLLPLATLPAG